LIRKLAENAQQIRSKPAGDKQEAAGNTQE